MQSLAAGKGEPLATNNKLGLGNRSAEKDLGILAPNKLATSQQCALAAWERQQHLDSMNHREQIAGSDYPPLLNTC